LYIYGVEGLIAMTIQFHLLSSGSAGNAAVLDVGTFSVLIDFGLAPRWLGQRMRRCRVSWDQIGAVILTHTHSDHWQGATLTQLAKRGLPVYCHPAHIEQLAQSRRAFKALSSAGLIRHYEPGERLILHPDCQCVPIALQHDAAMTCGFRFEGHRSIFGCPWAIAYAADLGCWTPELARHFADVELLALEFNHDVPMQLGSGRHPHLIRRILGEEGHLSNDQGAAFLAEVLRISEPGRLRHLVQLHLSQDCNRPELARSAAEQVMQRLNVALTIHTSDQDCAGPTIGLNAPVAGSARRASPRKKSMLEQPLLPLIES
jgi:phosphoribosyl 1,2-cyclic phosphodiesterase